MRSRQDVGFMQDSERGARLPITADSTMPYRELSGLPGLVCVHNCEPQLFSARQAFSTTTKSKITYVATCSQQLWNNTCSARAFFDKNRD